VGSIAAKSGFFGNHKVNLLTSLSKPAISSKGTSKLIKFRKFGMKSQNNFKSKINSDIDPM